MSCASFSVVMLLHLSDNVLFIQNRRAACLICWFVVIQNASLDLSIHCALSSLRGNLNLFRRDSPRRLKSRIFIFSEKKKKKKLTDASNIPKSNLILVLGP